MSKKPKEIMLSHLEVVVALIKDQGLHEGIWQLNIGFGRSTPMHAKDNDRVYPAVAVPLTRIGLIEVEHINPLAVNAALVNPKSRIVTPASPFALGPH